MTHRTASTARIFMVLLLTLPLTIVPKMAIAGGGGEPKPWKWCVMAKDQDQARSIQRFRLEVYERIGGAMKKLKVVKLSKNEIMNNKSECFKTHTTNIFVKAYVKPLTGDSSGEGEGGKKCGEKSLSWDNVSRNIYFDINKRAGDKYECHFH